MSPREIFALRDYLDPGLKGRTISDARQSASLTDISDRTCLDGRLAELSGRSVLLAVSDQFLAALVMLEVDGIARRMLLCPPDLNADHLQALIEDAEIDAVVTDQPDRFATLGIPLVVTAGADLKAASRTPTERATRMADADVRHVGFAEDRRPYARRPDRRDRRRRPSAGHPADLGDVLRHPPLRWFADFPARDHRRRVDGVVGVRAKSLPITLPA